MPYSILAYGKMIGDPVRIDAYVRALTASVREGDVVLDLGTGVGFFAVLACRLGASKVYAIESDDSIEIARRVAQINGCADRIEFIQDLSTAITLPDRANVLISDLRGVLPLFGQHIPSLIDARHRLVTPGGTVMPLRDEIWGTIIDSIATYQEKVEPWVNSSSGVDLSPVRHVVANTWSRERFAEPDFLSAPQRIFALDYETIGSPNVSAEMSWTCERDGNGHGLGLWFDATLIPGVGFTNAPGSPEAIYGNAFFPFDKPIELKRGDTVTVEVAANLVDSEYVWRWNTRASRNGTSLAEFRQSTMEAGVLPAAKLRKRRDDYVPTRTEEIRIAEFILHRLDGDSSLGSVARILAESYPARFKNWPAALAHVTKVVEQCT